MALIGSTAETMLGFRSGLIAALVAEHKEVYALASDYDDTTRARIKALDAVPVDYPLSRSNVNPVAELRSIVALARTLRSIAPDVIFCYFSKPVICGTAAGLLAGVRRRIGMLEGLGHAFTTVPGRRRTFLKHVQIGLYRLVFPLLERIIFLNEADRTELIEQHRIHARLSNVLGGIGLDLAAYPFSLPATEPVRFTFSGRLLAAKGIDDFLDAARIVKSRHPETRFLVLGKQDTDNRGAPTTERIRQCVAAQMIEYPGHVANVADWLAASSVFVLPSYYREGVPRSIQEAMAVGRPIITTDMPGCRETVIDGVNGFLVAPHAPDTIAEKMMFFINHREQITAMGRASHQLARQKFDERDANSRLVAWLNSAA